MARFIDPASHLSTRIQVIPSYTNAIPAPHQRWIVFRQSYHVRDTQDGPEPGPRQTAYVLYDPEQDTYRLLALPTGGRNIPLERRQPPQRPAERVTRRLDVVTGQTGPLGPATTEGVDATSKQYPDLTLDVEHRLLEDGKESGGYLESCLLWVRRTRIGNMPLGTVAAGLTPDWDDPQPAWSPTGKQIAFLSHGDLCVTDVTAATDLLPNEKMAVGLTLTGTEERHLAESHLKQIGLALVQYAQDNDERYPPAEGLNEAIYPYLRTRDVFQVGSHRFVYQLPEGTSLAKIESPADTIQGTIDLPCARVVLFVDGHVKSFPKQATAP